MKPAFSVKDNILNYTVVFKDDMESSIQCSCVICLPCGTLKFMAIDTNGNEHTTNIISPSAYYTINLVDVYDETPS